MGTENGQANGGKKQKLSRQARRRAKKKLLKAQQKKAGKAKKESSPPPKSKTVTKVKNEPVDEDTKMEPVKKEEPQVEYVVESLDFSSPQFAMFKEVLENFEKRGQSQVEEEEEEKKEKKAEKEEQIEKEEEEEEKPLSKTALKKKNRLSVAELKRLVERPDVVELHDANSADPKLLVHLKGYRNTVPVPKHWSQKRKFLQGKRGFEKPPFDLPQFIKDTGITKIRDEQNALDDGKSAKSRARQRMNPKLGRIDIDYQVLHDAFFRFQTKPDMTTHGQTYYEGREFEFKLSEKKPGDLSEELMNALGMTRGKNSPPPWLFNQQRYGPAPSYPRLKVPGVNCPIPPGAKYGFGPEEWGKPPVDQFGRSIWGGDVYGTATADDEEEERIDKTPWGQIEEEESDEESEEEEEEEEEEAQPDEDGDAQMGTESTTSNISGMITPEVIQLRKKDGTGTETPTTQRPLYQVLEQKDVSVEKGALFGSAHTYVLPTAGAASATSDLERRQREKKAAARAQVDVSLNPEELSTLDADTLKRKYQQQLDAEKAARQGVRAADVLADERSKKRHKNAQKSQS